MKRISKKYKIQINRLKQIQTILLVVCFISLVFFSFMLLKPKTIAYDLKDECGPVGGTISHSVDDAEACENACGAYCKSFKQDFLKSTFEPSTLECHNCTCFCRK